jgi:hypothetical protein
MIKDWVDEIADLAQALGQPLPADQAISLMRFSDQWHYYLEYQVSLDTGALGLVTLGETPKFLRKVGTYLQGIGVTVNALGLFKRIRRFAGLATWGLKVSTGEKQGIQLYVKKPLDVAEVLSWLQRCEVISLDMAGQVADIAAQLDKSHTHFLGFDFSPGQPVRYQIYFTQYLQATDSVPKRVRQVIQTLALPDSATQYFERYYSLLAQPERTLWVSIGLAEGAIMPTIKLDYEGVHLNVASMVLEDLGLEHPQLDYLNAINHSLQVETADYLGFRLTANHPPALSLYLTRVKGM